MPNLSTPSGSGQSPPEVFWGEMAPCDHLLQIYEHDETFLGTLESYVATGLDQGDAVVIIATAPHRAALQERLRLRGHSLSIARSRGQFLDLDAEASLARFLVRGWPDETLFNTFVRELLARGRRRHPRVRAFGEMVALLWAQGNSGATVRLEHLWHGACQRDGFPLFCAYPRIGLTQHPEASLREICETHSKMVPG